MLSLNMMLGIAAGILPVHAPPPTPVVAAPTVVSAPSVGVVTQGNNEMEAGAQRFRTRCPLLVNGLASLRYLREGLAAQEPVVNP